MRTYLVVIDDSPEASLALRFAARRAARTGGGVAVLAIIPPQDFVAFGGVQATIEAELLAPQGSPADVGGYYQPVPAMADAAMRPSATFNAALALLADN